MADIPHENIQHLLSKYNLPPAETIGRNNKVLGRETWSANYVLTFPSDAAIEPFHPIKTRAPDGHIRLVLRIVLPLLPRIRTENEVAVMRYLKRNTTIPVPTVLRFCTQPDNRVNHEFLLLEHMPGVSLDKAWDDFSDLTKYEIVKDLVEKMDSLLDKPFGHIGGLQLDEKDKEGQSVKPGPMVCKAFWTQPDIDKFWAPLAQWPAQHTLSSINALGPFDSFEDYCTAWMTRLLQQIQTHPVLLFSTLGGPIFKKLCDFQRQEDGRRSGMPAHDNRKGNNKFYLAHKGLHLRNIVCNESTGKITGVLDWSEAGIFELSRIPGLLYDLNKSTWLKGIRDRTLLKLEQNQADVYYTKEHDFRTRYVHSVRTLAQNIRDGNGDPEELRHSQAEAVTGKVRELRELHKEQTKACIDRAHHLQELLLVREDGNNVRKGDELQALFDKLESETERTVRSRWTKFEEPKVRARWRTLVHLLRVTTQRALLYRVRMNGDSKRSIIKLLGHLQECQQEDTMPASDLGSDDGWQDTLSSLKRHLASDCLLAEVAIDASSAASLDVGDD